MTKRKRILVVPPDKNNRFARYDEDVGWGTRSGIGFSENGCDKIIWSHEPVFALACVGAFSLLCRRRYNEKLRQKLIKWCEGWKDLASGKLKLSGCKLRGFTKAEFKEFRLKINEIEE